MCKGQSGNNGARIPAYEPSPNPGVVTAKFGQGRGLHSRCLR